jgi:replicative DNA helicase
MRRYEPPTPQEVEMEAYVSACQSALLNDANLMQWFADRGIPEDAVKAQRFGYHDNTLMGKPNELDVELGLTWPDKSNGTKAPAWMLDKHITIPYIRDGIIVGVRGRIHPNLQNNPGVQKYMSLHGAKGMPYYPSSIDPEEPVIICEGELDAVLLRLQGIQAIGVPGALNANMDWFQGFTRLYISFDGDDAGREGGDKLLKHLTEVRRIEMPEGYDASDYIQAFGAQSFTILMNRAVLYLHGKPQKEDRFSNLVTDYANWAWSNGTLLGPRIPWAPRFEEKMSGWAPGLILVGAEANSGKSCFKVKSLYELCVENPDDTIGVYLSLDDTWQEAMTRLMSLHSGIDFNKIVTPRHNIAHDPNLLKQYTDAFESLKQIENLIVRDATYGRSLSYLKSTFSSLRSKYPDKRIVVFIDSLAKITSDSGDDETPMEMSTKTNWKSYLASELKYLTTKHNICVVTATDLRKLNGARRPTRDDLKDAAELAYEANAILLCYNDLRRMRDDAVLYWTDPDTGERESIFEIIFDKNKITGKLGTVRFRMHGGTSDFWECDAAEDAENDRLMQQQLADKRRREAAA